MKVTDFSLAQHIIKDLCRMERVPFVDVSVSFGNEGDGLNVVGSKSVCHTLYQIISSYIGNSEQILGKALLADDEQRNDFLAATFMSLTSVAFSENTFSSNVEELSLQGLYQRPLVWIIMKDIICPMYDVTLENIRVVSGNNPQVDIAQYYEKGEIDVGDFENYPFIFVNEVENKPVLNALVFIEVLKAFKLDPAGVLLEIFENEIFDKLDGLLTLAFNDNPEGKQVFMHTLTNVLRIERKEKIVTAQSADERPDRQNQFWFLGLIEGMLGKTRGSDWSTTKSLQPYVEAFWEKVEELKVAKKGQNVTFNELLQLKREEGPDGVDTTRTLQQLIGSDRIW
jgi:hypothetical protein